MGDEQGGASGGVQDTTHDDGNGSTELYEYKGDETGLESRKKGKDNSDKSKATSICGTILSVPNLLRFSTVVFWSTMF